MPGQTTPPRILALPTAWHVPEDMVEQALLRDTYYDIAQSFYDSGLHPRDMFQWIVRGQMDFDQMDEVERKRRGELELPTSGRGDRVFGSGAMRTVQSVANLAESLRALIEDLEGKYKTEIVQKVSITALRWWWGAGDPPRQGIRLGAWQDSKLYRNNAKMYNQFIKRKRCVMEIKEKGNICAGIAVVMALDYGMQKFTKQHKMYEIWAVPPPYVREMVHVVFNNAAMLGRVNFWRKCKTYQESLDNRKKSWKEGSIIAKNLAKYILEAVGLEEDQKAELIHIQRLSDLFRVPIKLRKPDKKATIIQEVMPEGVDGPQDYRINLQVDGEHSNLIKSMRAYTGYGYYCGACDKSYKVPYGHMMCKWKCRDCYSRDCPKEILDYTVCEDCNKKFKSKECYELHKTTKILRKGHKEACTVCECQIVCGKEGCTPFDPIMYAPHPWKEAHVCGESICSACRAIKGEDHRCFMPKPKEEDKPKRVDDSTIIYFDVECRQEEEDGQHIHYITHVAAWYGHEDHPAIYLSPKDADGDNRYGVRDKFCEWLFRKEHQFYKVYAHCGGRYDFQLLKRWLMREGHVMKTIYAEGSIKKLKSRNVTLVDSYSHLAMQLEKMPKAFGIETLKKGFYAYLFNTWENRDYKGPMPSIEYYQPEKMKEDKRKDFLEWYNEKVESGYEYDHEKETKEYVMEDVRILKTVVNKFRDECWRELDVDPASYVTLPAMCLDMWKHFHMVEETVAVLTRREAVFIKESFVGGRTQTFRAHCNVEGTNKKIRYDDFMSLYPHINATGKYPKGAPAPMETYDPEMEQSPEWIQAMLKETFGFIKVDVTCPKNILIPVLYSRRNADGGRLVFDLRDKVAQTYFTEELNLALEEGYVVTRIHERLHYPEHTIGIFKDYVMKLLRRKEECSGWAGKKVGPDMHDATTEEEKEEWLKGCEEFYGFRLDKDKIEKNDAKRQVFKLCLNSLWGKFAQRSNLTDFKVFEEWDIEKMREFCEEHWVWGYEYLEETKQVELRYTEYESQSDADPGANQNIAIAAATTAQARMTLYRALKIVGDRALYCDTDSVIWIDEPGKPQLPRGDKLGQLTDELDEGDWIVEYVSTGAKSYAYRTFKGKNTVKAKGMRMSYENRQTVLNLENYKNMVFSKKDNKRSFEDTVYEDRIDKDRATGTIYTRKNFRKKAQFTADNKGVLNTEDWYVYPYGYEGPTIAQL